MHKQILNNRSFRRNADPDFHEVYSNIDRYVSKDHIDSLIDKTASEILEMTKGKKAAYAWSGGKDSVVIGLLCETVGISKGVLGLSELEYPIFLDWLKDNMPIGMDVINTGQDIPWLLERPHMLFPSDSKHAAMWYKGVQQEAQRLYYKEQGLDVIILGRRKAEGNYVGKKGSNIYSNRDGTTRYSPISEWTHEEVLAAMRYYDLPLAPFYSFPISFYYGTHPWARRNRHPEDVKNGTTIHTWREIKDIDPKVIEIAAPYYKEAESLL